MVTPFSYNYCTLPTKELLCEEPEEYEPLDSDNPFLSLIYLISSFILSCLVNVAFLPFLRHLSFGWKSRCDSPIGTGMALAELTTPLSVAD